VTFRKQTAFNVTVRRSDTFVYL